MSAAVAAPIWLALLLLLGAIRYPSVRTSFWIGRRAFGNKWLDIRAHAGQLNQKLDKNIFYSALTWVIGTISTLVVALALDDKYSRLLPPWYPIDSDEFLKKRWLVWVLLLVGPTLGGLKKILRKLELRDAVAERDLLNTLASNLLECFSQVVRQVSLAEANAKVDAATFIQQSHIAIAGHVAIAFSRISGEDLSCMKVIPCLFEDGKLCDISVRGPASAEARSTLEELAAEGTTIIRCHKKGRSIVISDIQLEIKKRSSRFSATKSNPEGARGSIICYPVKLGPGTVCCVFSVYCQKPSRFFESERDFYDRELGSYGRLLVMSHAFARKLREVHNGT